MTGPATTTTGSLWLASAGIDGSIHLWNPVTGAASAQTFGHPSSVWAMVPVPVEPGVTWLACGGTDGVIRLWDPLTGREMRALEGHENGVYAMAVVPRGTGTGWLASADVDGMIRLWDVQAGRSVRQLAGHTNSVQALAVVPMPDGSTTLASADGDGLIRLWDPARGQELRSWQAHDNVVWALAVVSASDGPMLCSAGADGWIRLWNVANGDSSAPAEFGHDGGVIYDLAAVTGKDGTARLASAGIDGGIRLWDPRTGSQTARLSGHDGPVRAVTPVPRGGGAAWLASGGGDGAVRIWDLASDELVREFRGHWGSVLEVASLALSGDPAAAPRGRDARERELDEAVAGVGIPGFADRAATVDRLGRADLVHVVVGLLDAAGELTDPDSGPSVISIEGPWGAGKTTLMQLVQAGLEAPRPTPAATRSRRRRLLDWAGNRWQSRPFTVAEADWAMRRRKPPPRYRMPAGTDPAAATSVTVWFNPWAHQSSEQVWAGLTREIIHASRRVLHPDVDEAERYWFRRNLGRLDGRDMKRQLWRRIASPLLRISVLATLVPVIVFVLSKQFDSKAPRTVHLLGGDFSAGALALLLPAAVLALGLAHTFARYAFGRASSFLPGELFRGPALSSGVSPADAASRLALRDPLYDAASGYLYLLQHDVREVLKDIEQAGRQLVIFIDDLDRCGPGTTAEVFEAINLFLSESFPRARFVIGLDPVVVAIHLDRTYTELLGRRAPSYPGDPSPGWTFLRKLIQLPIVLPRVSDESLGRLLDDKLGPAVPVEAPPAAPPPPPAPAAPAEAPPAAARPAEPPPTEPPPARTPPVETPPAPVPTFALERHPEVRAYLLQRLSAQPDRSARHAKRLLTVWQFYVRLFDRVRWMGGADAVRRARQLVVVAEIITRWPAQLRELRQVVSGRNALHLLYAARHDELAWHRTLGRLRIDSGTDALADLRELLVLCGDDGTVADLFAAVT